MTRRLALAAALLVLFAFTGRAAEPQKLGQPLAGLEPVTLEKLLAKPEDGKTVRLEGTIKKVCQRMGCWLELEQGKASVHVTMKDHSFFVPKDAAGSAAVLEGKVVVAEPDPATVKHLEEEGAGAAAAARVSIEASGVEIRAARKD